MRLGHYLDKTFLYFSPKLIEFKKAKDNINPFGFLFTLILALMFFISGYGALEIIAEDNEKRINTDIIINVVVHYYLYIIILAGILSAMNSLYTSRGLDFYLSKPFNKFTFFISKILEVAQTTVWFTIIIGLPLVFILFFWQKASVFFLLSGLIIISIIHLTSATLATLGGLLLGPLVRPGMARKIAILAVSLLGFYYFVQISDVRNINALLELTSLEKLEKINSFIPLEIPFASICTKLLLNFAKPEFYKIDFNLVLQLLIWLSAIALLASIVFCKLYLKLFHYFQSKSFKKNQSKKNKLNFIPFKSKEFKSVWMKEVLSFERDSINSMQMLILFAILIVYILSLYRLPNYQDWPILLREWSIAGMILVNMLTILMISSILCARFVYTTVSLDGESKWIFQSSPISLKDYLLYKKKVWLILISLLTLLALIVSTQIISTYPLYFIVSMTSGLIVTFGLVGIGIGLSAVYVNYKWENIAELTGSIGNFMYLFICFVFVIANLIPIIFMIALSVLIKNAANIATSEIILLYTILMLGQIYFAYLISKLSIRLGVKKLQNLM